MDTISIKQERPGGVAPLSQKVSLAIRIRRGYVVGTAIACALVATLLVSLFVVKYERRVKVTGKIAPYQTTIRVVSPQVGVITSSKLFEGKPVERGDPLFTISAERNDHNGSVEVNSMRHIDRELDNLQGQLKAYQSISELQLRQKREEMHAFLDQIESIENEIATETKRAGLYRENVKKFGDLAKIGYISTMQLSQREDELLAQLSHISQLKRQKITLENDLANARIQIDLARQQATSDRYKLDSNRSSLIREAIEIGAKREQIVTSPITGTVTAVQGVQGQSVAVNQPVLAIIPANTSLVGKLIAPSAAMGFLQIGQEVFIRYSAFPYQKFGSYRAKVVAFNEASIAKSSENASDSFYEITIELERQTVLAYGRQVKIKADMTIEADIIVEKRTLIEWIFEPFFAAGRRW
jgi:membrane fusion protein